MPMAFVDLKKRPPAPGELKRFAQKFGARALLDEDSKAFKRANLGYLTMGDSEVIDRVIAEPKLLRLPLVRYGDELTIGVDEEAWRAWHRAGDSPPGAPS